MQNVKRTDKEGRIQLPVPRPADYSSISVKPGEVKLKTSQYPTNKYQLSQETLGNSLHIFCSEAKLKKIKLKNSNLPNSTLFAGTVYEGHLNRRDSV